MQAWFKNYFEILNGSDWYVTKTLKGENPIKYKKNQRRLR